MYLLLLLSSYSIPVASSTLVVVDLCCTAIVSHSVTVTVMLKRQRHSGSLFSCFTDSPECPQASLVSLSNIVVLLIPQSVLSASHVTPLCWLLRPGRYNSRPQTTLISLFIARIALTISDPHRYQC